MISPSLYPLSIGGPANVTSFLVRELHRNGIELSIIFEVACATQAEIQLLMNFMEVGDGCELIPLQLSSEWGSRIASSPSAIAQIAKKVRCAEIVHFQTYPSVLPYSTILAYAKAKCIPCILSYHGLTSMKIRHPGRMRTLLECLQLPYFLMTKNIFDAVIVPSYSMTRLAELEGFRGEKIRMIPNGIDLSKSQEAEPMKLDGEPVILWVGYTGWEKGGDIALGAMKIVLDTIPSARLHFVGYYHTGFLEDIRREGLEGSVIVHGPISPLRMPSYYAGADICINPSRFESFSLVVLEAMAAGKPIVATRLGGMKELITDGVNGLWAQPDAHSFSEAIIRIYKNIDLREHIVRNAIKKAKELDWSNIVGYYLRLYAELVED